MRKFRKNEAADGGFTLVEVLLALVVFGVGMLAVLGLFTSSMDVARRMKSDTITANFAEESLNAYCAAAQTNFVSFESTVFDTAGVDIWNNPDDLMLAADGKWYINIYEYYRSSPVAGELDYIEDYSLRYKIDVTNQSRRIKSITVFVRPGEFDPNAPTNIFYTQVFDYEG